MSSVGLEMHDVEHPGSHSDACEASRLSNLACRRCAASCCAFVMCRTSAKFRLDDTEP